MKIPDVNVLIYAANSASAQHAAAKEYLEDCYNTHQPIGYAWIALLGFIGSTALAKFLLRGEVIE